MLCRVIFLIRSHLSPLPFSSLKQQPSTTPICMFYFAHPFGISTPSSTATTNIEAAKKKSKKSTKYTTTTYLVTEIQKNVDESSQDECCDHSKSSYAEQDMLPWPQSLLLPPPIIQQLIEKRKGKTRRERAKKTIEPKDCALVLARVLDILSLLNIHFTLVTSEKRDEDSCALLVWKKHTKGKRKLSSTTDDTRVKIIHIIFHSSPLFFFSMFFFSVLFYKQREKQQRSRRSDVKFEATRRGSHTLSVPVKAVDFHSSANVNVAEFISRRV